MPDKSSEIKTRGARFVRFYPSDWRSGCIGLTLEQEGLYVRICAFIYESGGRLTLDDCRAAKFMGVHTNAYRKVRDQLQNLGKLVKFDDGWTVARAEKELAAAIGTNSERHIKRQADQDEGRESRQDTIGNTPLDTRIDTLLDTRVVCSENANKINGPSLEPIANSQEPIQTDRASAGQPVFNQASENLIQDAARWMGTDRNHAVKWLTSTISASSSDAVMSAYSQLLATQAKGKLIADPIRYIGKTAPTLKSSAAKPAADNVLMFEGKPFVLTGPRNVRPRLD